VVSLQCGRLEGQPPCAESLHAWFAADAGVTEVDGEVTEWQDQAGGGYVLAPSGGPPSLALNVVNGLPALGFDGTTDLNGSLGATTLAKASVFAVFRYTVSSSDNDYCYTLGTSGNAGSQITLSRRSGDRAHYFDGARSEFSPDGVLPTNEWFVSSQIFGAYSPDSHDLFLNGASVMRTEAFTTYSVDAAHCVIGNWSSDSFRFIGDLVELLVYDEVLSEPERSEVEDYLRERAGLPEFFKPEAEVLSDWEVIQYEFDAQPDAFWIFDLGGTRADQVANSDASILLGDIDVANKVIWGQFGSGSAPDFMGFVFGFQNMREFYLFDWKKETASYRDFGEASQGMRLTAFHLQDAEPGGVDFWASDVEANTTVLRQNDIPWDDGVDYDFSIRFTPGFFVIRVWEGETLLESWEVTDSTYTAGGFGYFVNSLQDVRFGQVFVNDLGPITMDRIERVDDHVSLRWLGGEPPYVVQESPDLKTWTPVTGHIWNRVDSLPLTPGKEFFRVRSIGEELSSAP
jgi:hypothetical protein